MLVMLNGDIDGLFADIAPTPGPAEHVVTEERGQSAQRRGPRFAVHRLANGARTGGAPLSGLSAFFSNNMLGRPGVANVRATAVPDVAVQHDEHVPSFSGSFKIQ